MKLDTNLWLIWLFPQLELGRWSISMNTMRRALPNGKDYWAKICGTRSGSGSGESQLDKMEYRYDSKSCTLIISTLIRTSCQITRMGWHFCWLYLVKVLKRSNLVLCKFEFWTGQFAHLPRKKWGCPGVYLGVYQIQSWRFVLKSVACRVKQHQSTLMCLKALKHEGRISQSAKHMWHEGWGLPNLNI